MNERLCYELQIQKRAFRCHTMQGICFGDSKWIMSGITNNGRCAVSKVVAVQYLFIYELSAVL